MSERNDWVTRVADDLMRGRQSDGKVVLASGISPSGPVHLGNLREILTTHFVYMELVMRGIEAEHILSWDDFDRFRKVPEGVPGVDETWVQYIGMPYTSIPAPAGSPHSSWAEHFKAQLRDSLTMLNVDVREISQTQMYTSGAYVDHVITAMNRRAEIGEVLRGFQTKNSQLDVNSYYPYRPYCAHCGTDYTTVTSYDADSHMMAYTCRCGYSDTVNLETYHNGKLVWKADWAMRWVYESVDFEAAGVDHRSPGSSWDAGQHIAPIFGGERPAGIGYSFVGVEGAAKMSSSAGNAPTPQDALNIMTPAMLRWLYARRKPSQSFNIDFGAGHQKLFDEWDALTRKVSEGRGKVGDNTVYARATWGVTDADATVVPFKVLASTVDVTTGNVDEFVRILNECGYEVGSYEDISQRTSLASLWLENYVPQSERVMIRDEVNVDLLNSMSDEQTAMMHIVLNQMGQRYSLGELTKLIFGAPKVQHGYDEMERDLPDEVKAAQQLFFKNMYMLLTESDHGPRLPSLFICLGEDKVRHLLGE